MPNYRVSLSFVKLRDADLDEFGSTVVASLTGNASFPTPLVPLATLGTARTDFHDALVEASGGGAMDVAMKNQKRLVLEDLLRQEASYVQGLAGQDLAMLLSSGFNANSTNRSRSPLEKPVVASLENLATTMLLLRLDPVVNARAYEVQTRNGGGWVPAGIFTQARSIVLPGFTPGQTYTVQARAIGGATGYSDWSNPVSHMAM